MAHDEPAYRYRQIRMGRFEVVHWKGWAAAFAFIPIAALGLWVETSLIQIGHPVLYFSIMIPFGLLVVAGTAVLAGKIDRS
jgi:hypothetical protein